MAWAAGAAKAIAAKKVGSKIGGNGEEGQNAEQFTENLLSKVKPYQPVQAQQAQIMPMQPYQSVQMPAVQPQIQAADLYTAQLLQNWLR